MLSILPWIQSLCKKDLKEWSTMKFYCTNEETSLEASNPAASIPYSKPPPRRYRTFLIVVRLLPSDTKAEKRR